MGGLVGLLTCIMSPTTSAFSTSYPESLATTLETFLANDAPNSSDPTVLLKVAGLYLDIGDDLLVDQAERKTAYEKGSRFAAQALKLHEANARAHFLYAANLGKAVKLEGVLAAASTINTLKFHAQRALELQNDYAPALHMMGTILEKVPGFLGGDSVAALDYLQQAVAAQPNYAEARLDLAKAYITRNDLDAARRELNAILNMTAPTNTYTWQHRARPQAQQLLAELP